MRRSLEEAALPLLKAASPFPDETPAVSCEVVRETASGAIAIAATLPSGSSDDIADALDAAKLNITRIDALPLGVLRTMWPQIAQGGAGDARRIVAVAGEDGYALFVTDGEAPVALRALPFECNLRHEAMLSLLRAEDFAGPAPVAEVVLIDQTPVAASAAPAADDSFAAADGEAAPAAPAGASFPASAGEDFSVFGPVRRLVAPEGAAVAGVAERSLEPGSLNALPAEWAEVLDETRFKRKAGRILAAAGCLWLLAMAAIAGGPFVYGFMTDRLETVRRQHRSAYNKVNEKKRQVEAVRLVSNHDLGALESLRVVASAMPEQILLSKWNFKRGEKLSFSGTAEDGDQQKVYNFKDGLAGVMLSQISENEEDGETPFFADVALPRGVVSRGSKAVFDIECSFKAQEEE